MGDNRYAGAEAFTRGTTADAVELAEFAARCFQETFAADNDPEDLKSHLSATYGAAQQSAELADPDVKTILMREAGALIAYAQVRKSPPPPCVPHDRPIELHRFYLDRPAQGTGLASRLMQEAHRAARELAGAHLWLGVWERNARAIAFYSKAGFVDVGSQYYWVGPDRQLDRVMIAAVTDEAAGTYF